MKKTHLVLFALLCLYLPLAFAANPQNHAEIRDTVLAFVRAQTQGLPGKVSIQV